MVYKKHIEMLLRCGIQSIINYCLLVWCGYVNSNISGIIRLFFGETVENATFSRIKTPLQVRSNMMIYKNDKCRSLHSNMMSIC